MKYRKEFYFDGKSSKDFGLYISGGKTFGGPEMNVETVSVPGRNGDLFISGDSYKNVSYTYDAFIYNEQGYYEEQARRVRSWLTSKKGYKRLEDDYHPGEFRMAIYKGPVSFNTILLTAGTLTLTFNCKPQRFFKSGETPLIFSSSGSLFNPYYFASKPLIKVTGSTGTFTIGDYSVTVTETNGIVIDSEIEQAYKGTTYKNNKVSLANYKFPQLLPGPNTITIPSGMTLEITPRWFEV